MQKKEDLQQIKRLFKDNNEVLDKKLDQKFKDNNEVLDKKLDQKFKDNNEVLTGKLDQKFKDNNGILLKKMDEKIDELAGVVNQGFSELENKMNKKFLGIDKRFDQTDEKLCTLEKGHEDIRLRLNNVAYRFEVVELQKRVEVLEKKLNIQFSR